VIRSRCGSRIAAFSGSFSPGSSISPFGSASTIARSGEARLAQREIERRRLEAPTPELLDVCEERREGGERVLAAEAGRRAGQQRQVGDEVGGAHWLATTTTNAT
jgi:hypothetical protein